MPGVRCWALLSSAGSVFWELWKIWQLCGGDHSSQGFLWLLRSLSGKKKLSALEIEQSSPALSRAAGDSCQGLCPVAFWVSPRMETTQPLWATCHTVQPPITVKDVFLMSFLICTFCLHFFHWAALREIWLHHIYPPWSHQEFVHMDGKPWSLLQKNLSQLSQALLAARRCCQTINGGI